MKITPVSAAIIITALAVLGVLAFLKIDGASVAAIAAVGTVIAWLTTPPQKSDRDSLPPGESK